MKRFQCLLLSLAFHAMIYVVLIRPASRSTDTGSGASIVLPSTIVTAESTAESPGKSDVSPTPDKVLSITYQAKPGERPTGQKEDRVAGAGPSAAAKETLDRAETEPRQDDFSRAEGMKAPLLRVTGLDAATINRLTQLGHARLVMVRDGVEALIDGPLEQPTGVRPPEGDHDLGLLSERMLPLPLAARILLMQQVREKFPHLKVAEPRLALTTRFDNYLLQCQQRALEKSSRVAREEVETIGRFQFNSEGAVTFVIDRVR